MKPARNPYADRPLDELWRAAQRRAGELLGTYPLAPTDADGKRALATDTGHLLLSMAAHVTSGEHLPSAPEKDMKHPGATLHAAFLRHYELEAKGARWRTLMRAADYVLGGDRHHWVQSTRIHDRRAAELATESDDGLRLVLEALEALRESKR